MGKTQTRNSGIWIILIALMLMLLDIVQAARQSQIVPFSQFERALSDGLITEVIVADQTIQGRLKKYDGQKAMLVTARSNSDLVIQGSKYKITKTHADEQTWVKDLISWIIPPLFFFGILILLQRETSDP